MRLKLVFLHIFLLTIIGSNYAQFSVTSDCCNSTEIVICQEGNINMLSYGEPIFMDNNNDFITYYPGTTKRSLWYKIYVNTNCKMTFTIFPTDTNDVYNYLLYKEPKGGGDFCQDVMVKTIVPERVNLMEDKSSIGVGLADNANISYNHSDKDSLKKVLTHTAYHNALNARDGDVYYLIVYHMEGDDCGHFFTLKTDSFSANFYAIREKCVEGLLTATSITNQTVETTDCQNWKRTVEKEKSIPLVTIYGKTYDDRSKNPIQTKIKYYDEKTDREYTATSDSFGNYKIVLEQRMLYKMTCSAIGFKKEVTNVLYQDIDSNGIKIDFNMFGLNAGETFVLDDIYFYPNNYAIKPLSYPVLNELLSYMQKYENATIEIQGHTNGEAKIRKKKSKAFNDEGWDFKGNEKKLSSYRANAVKKYLIKNGIDKERMTAIGFGAEKMLYLHPKNQQEKDMNKRVEIVLLTTDKPVYQTLVKNQRSQ